MNALPKLDQLLKHGRPKAFVPVVLKKARGPYKQREPLPSPYSQKWEDTKRSNPALRHFLGLKP